MQFGSYLAGPGFPSGHNLTATGGDPAANYTFYDFTDAPNYADLPLDSVSDTCFSTKPRDARSPEESLVDDCAAATGVNCCYNFSTNSNLEVRIRIFCKTYHSMDQCLHLMQSAHQLLTANSLVQKNAPDMC